MLSVLVMTWLPLGSSLLGKKSLLVHGQALLTAKLEAPKTLRQQRQLPRRAPRCSRACRRRLWTTRPMAPRAWTPPRRDAEVNAAAENVAARDCARDDTRRRPGGLGPLEEAARRIRDYANAASPIFSPLSNFRFRSWAKALALEEVMSRAGADRVPRAQLEGVFDEWLGGNLDVSSSGEMRKIVEARESYASVFLALALGAAALRGVQLQSRKNSGG